MGSKAISVVPLYSWITAEHLRDAPEKKRHIRHTFQGADSSAVRRLSIEATRMAASLSTLQAKGSETYAYVRLEPKEVSLPYAASCSHQSTIHRSIYLFCGAKKRKIRIVGEPFSHAASHAAINRLVLFSCQMCWPTCASICKTFSTKTKIKAHRRH